MDDPSNFIFPRPAVFVSFGLGQYQSMGNGVLCGNKILRIRAVHENYRIARSLSHLAKLIEDFESRGIHFKSIQESFIDTTSPHGKFVFNIFASVAQLERDIIIERTRAGLESARRRGTKLGRQPGLSKEAQHKAMLAERYYRDNKLSIAEIMKLVDIKSKRTLYKYLAHQGRRICKACGTLFWDQQQEMDKVYCTKHQK